MSFNLPTDFASRPVAMIGAGTLGRRIALMFAAHGADVYGSTTSPTSNAAPLSITWRRTFPHWRSSSPVLCREKFRSMPTSATRCTMRGW